MGLLWPTGDLPEAAKFAYFMPDSPSYTEVLPLLIGLRPSEILDC